MRHFSSPLLLAVLLTGTALLVGCGGPQRLAIDPSAGSLEPAPRTGARPPADSLFGSCSGVAFGGEVLEMQCVDLQTFYAARYDAPATDETCRDMIGRLFEGASVQSSDAFPLFGAPHSYGVSGVEQSGRFRRGEAGSHAACGPHRDGGLALFIAQGGPAFDSSFVADALPALAHEGAPASRLSPARPDSLPWLGRTLRVHPSCQMKGARNLSCYPNGQMHWSTFSSLARAQEAQAFQVESSRRSASEVLADTTLGCTFEGTATQCRRLVYRLPVSKLATLGATNVLIAFYAAAEVRGAPAQAVCSFFRDQATPNGLAALCRESFDVPGAAALMESSASGG